MDGVDAVVFTLGSDGAGKVGAQRPGCAGFADSAHRADDRHRSHQPRTGAYNRVTEAHDWKRRSERLVRASGLPYTIVRPGCFDYNGPDEHQLVLLQGDTHQAGDSSDGVIARRQIAEVLVHSLGSDRALRKTFELIATTGPAQDDFDALFAPLDADPHPLRERKMKRISVAIIVALLVTIVKSSPLYGKTEHVRSVTAITEVFGDGQKVSAVAVEYDAPIVSAALSSATFSVDGKSITRVYANKAAEKAAHGVDGRYVIIELSTASRIETGAPQFGPGGRGPGGPGLPGPGRGGAALAPPPPVSVTQLATVPTAAGGRYPADATAMTSDRTINRVVDDFQQLVFTDPSTGEILRYNLFVPKDYDKNKSYPMVLFIHDASVVGTDTRRTLIQGVGGVIWATPGEQAKHESFVLAPQYHTDGVVNDNSEASEYLDITVNLVNAVASQYSIDRSRIYTTGQSMGCMLSIAMNIKYPDLFAASMLVAGQWDAKLMSVLAHKKMWILVAEGDTRAFPGMNASTAAMEAAGGKVSRARWNARAGAAEMAANVKKMIEEGNNIKYVVFEKGTVWPDGESGGMEHMQTWKVAYYIEGVRDWLFTQRK